MSSDTSTQSSMRTLDVGMVLNDKWVILELIGKGGMGEVYRAHQLNLKRDVAIKVISHDFLASVDDNDYEMTSSLERFRREVQVMAQVSHPNVLQIYDHDSAVITKNGREMVVEYIAMEYIPGGMTLRDTMSEEGFYPDEAPVVNWLRDYFLPLLEGMQALHDLGIVHRDLKPENILLEEGQAKIADFGLARSCRLKPITQSMDVKGTPPYMSPEHFMDLKRTDQRTDIYALGKMLYEAVAGRMGSDQIPFKTARLKEPETPFFKRMDRIIREATAEERDQRTESVEVLARQVRELLALAGGDGESGADSTEETADGSRRVLLLWVLAILLMVGGITLGVTFFLQQAHPPGSSKATNDVPAPASILSSQGAGQSRSQSVVAVDYDMMHLITGGTLVLPADFGSDAGRVIRVQSFRMNEALVTNQQYVNFLNSVPERITVKDQVVRGDGRIWLFLGEVVKDYEPIVFRSGRFFVKNAIHTACPVVRVTAYGAKAYVDYYGLRLPSEQEWIYVAKNQVEAERRQAQQSAPWQSGETWMMNEMMGANKETPGQDLRERESSLPINTPVTVFKPNRYGIRQLNKNLGEWTVRSVPGQEQQYVVMGWPSAAPADSGSIACGIKRHPWEAFEEVGFRCVVSRGRNPQSKPHQQEN